MQYRRSVLFRHGDTSLGRVQAELAARILQMTDNGEEVIQFFLGVMRDAAVSLRHRLAAAQWLANRVWGKEPDVIHLNTGGIFESLLMASDEELERLAAGDLSGLPDLRGRLPAASVSQAGTADGIHDGAYDGTPDGER